MDLFETPDDGEVQKSSNTKLHLRLYKVISCWSAKYLSTAQEFDRRIYM